MNKESDKFGFSVHSLERGLERIMNLEPPYSQKQMKMMELFVTKSRTWNPFKCRWVIEDYNAELVIKNSSVVTIIIAKTPRKNNYKPITQFEKVFSKKCKQMGNARNNKNRYKKD